MGDIWREADGLIEVDPADRADVDVLAAVRHLEDLDIFVGQRSRLHPGPGWAITLALIRRDLATMRTEQSRRQAARPLGV